MSRTSITVERTTLLELQQLKLNLSRIVGRSVTLEEAMLEAIAAHPLMSRRTEEEIARGGATATFAGGDA